MKVVEETFVLAVITLLPTQEQEERIEKTQSEFLDCVNWLNGKVPDKIVGQSSIHKMFYYEARDRYSLPSNLIVQAIARVRHVRDGYTNVAGIDYDNRTCRIISNKKCGLSTIDGREEIKCVLHDYTKSARYLLFKKEEQWFLELAPLWGLRNIYEVGLSGYSRF